jgi:uncharacterized protein (UPF0276 family)
LDLSVYKDKSQIPFQWQIKYVKDQITRKVDLTNVPLYPTSRTEEKRIATFLKSHATKDFMDTTGWIQM